MKYIIGILWNEHSATMYYSDSIPDILAMDSNTICGVFVYQYGKIKPIEPYITRSITISEITYTSFQAVKF